ncbi:penicillin-binding protein activator [Chelatococcus reniformis]|uniref:Penicillin-binding protein activator n=1 Tax=Chelatococcus reniformis TaxID=1494448 RepID=A0A916X8M1_9HYPH|nr:penicillin-binding protein activator [Chelatococcus reniformis]GGC52268.1 penicillin-binding protein activator [Chelatococcus reniformis]
MPFLTDPPSRRDMLRLALKLGVAAPVLGLAAGCTNDMGGLTTGEPVQPAATLGSGAVKVGLILPLSAQGGVANTAASMRNAADLALAEFGKANIQIVVFDDGGTAEGARAAARAAVAQNVELILGPLLAPAVAAAGQVAKAAGRPVIAFSTDASVASPGVYLMSFLPASDVQRVVSYAASQGRTAFAAAISETPYGNVTAGAFQQVVPARQGRIVGLERFSGDNGADAVRRLAGVLAAADALFLPDGAALPSTAGALPGAGFDKAKVKPLGTSQWNEGSLLRLPALQGGWFAAPPSTGFYAFSDRYRAKYGGEPSRIASLTYDAVSLVAALERTQGAARFSEATLTNPSGFSGADGVFRFRSDGLNDRALAVYEVRAGDGVAISPAPKSLGS